ncbi:MAG TPA: hypothetical protein VK524_29090 [Polyangiaceae bacterium]|nr:hypothetical protein [Polyangiaceae bacterium]
MHRTRTLAVSLGCLLALYACPARANGRMPGATALSLAGGDSQQIVVRATFGFVQSFDSGVSWRWICENAIQVSGESDPPFAVTEDGTLVLLPLSGGALVSRDQGCSWPSAPGPLEGKRTIDLTLDPSNPAGVLVITSTVAEIDDQGVPTYDNTLVETRDNAGSWAEMSSLPGDFRAETLEIAPSDSQRIYVSGTANDNPLQGVLLRSEDRGKTWNRHLLALPDSSGSLYISAIHPTDADRVWLRVPALNDYFGLYPASLVMTRNKGQSFEVLATTQRAMFGFALSPDGSELAYGGPTDGLYVGASDGSSAFAKVSTTAVRCLKWNMQGLYACGTEPGDPFSIGRSRDRGASFDPMYRIAQTCPHECGEASEFSRACRGPWRTVGPAIGANAAACPVQWLDPDAGSEAGADAGNAAGGSAGADHSEAGGCSCSQVPSASLGSRGAAVLLALSVLCRTRRRRGSFRARSRSLGRTLLAIHDPIAK